jgi:hypothetical protein
MPDNPPPAKGTPPPKGKLTARNPVTWVIILGVAVAGGAYLLYRRSRSSGSASSSTGTAVDPSAALGTLQSEIGNLQSSGGFGGGTSVVPVGSTSGGAGTVTTDGTGPASGGNSSGASGGTTSSDSGSPGGSSSSGGGTAVLTAPKVTNGHVVSHSGSRATIAWDGPGATQWAVTRFGPGSPNGITNIVHAPEAVYSGLAAGHTYYAIVQPLVNGQPAGPSGRIDFNTK